MRSTRRDLNAALAAGALALALAGCSAAHPTTDAAGRTASNRMSTQSATPTPPAASEAGPTSSPRVTPSGPSLAGKVVVLDPGHNGGNATHPTEVNRLVPAGNGTTKACDTTGTETNAGYPEHAFTFDVSLRVRSLLRARGIRVILTRDSDDGVGPCVNERAAIGNQAHADAAVSIHGDGNIGGHGFQVIQAQQSQGGAANDLASHRLAEAMHGAFITDAGLVPATYIGQDGYEDRSDLAGLNLSTRPKVLVECGNMRDAGDAALMSSAAGRQRIAVAIADGIENYLAGDS